MACGTLPRILRKEAQLKCFKFLTVLVLLYGSETWTMRKRDETRVDSTKLKFLRSVKKCTNVKSMTKSKNKTGPADKLKCIRK
jgi:hypothetical protein